jgi:hypothetical protein
VSYFLGFNVFRDCAKRMLFISQEHYLEGILDRFGLSTCSPTKTPLPSGYKRVTTSLRLPDNCPTLKLSGLSSTLQQSCAPT